MNQDTPVSSMSSAVKPITELMYNSRAAKEAISAFASKILGYITDATEVVTVTYLARRASKNLGMSFSLAKQRTVRAIRLLVIEKFIEQCGASDRIKFWRTTTTGLAEAKSPKYLDPVDRRFPAGLLKLARATTPVRLLPILVHLRLKGGRTVNEIHTFFTERRIRISEKGVASTCRFLAALEYAQAYIPEKHKAAGGVHYIYAITEKGITYLLQHRPELKPY